MERIIAPLHAGGSAPAATFTSAAIATTTSASASRKRSGDRLDDSVDAAATPYAPNHTDSLLRLLTTGVSSSGDAVATAAVPAARPRARAAPKRATRAPASSSATGSTDELLPEQVDDKVLRRRLQYKMHQRRHRAKQKARIESLEHEVHALLSDVASLEAQAKRLRERSVFASRGALAGTPARVALEFFRMYEHGWSPVRWGDQERFLQCVMSQEIAGPDYVGVEALKEQWRLYGHFFSATRYELHGYDVSTRGELTVVEVDLTMSLRPRRDGVTALCPSLRGHEALIQDVVGSAIVAPGKYRFIFDKHGRVSWLGADMDFVVGLQRSLGSLERVAAFMAGARMSFGTGQIRCDPSGRELPPLGRGPPPEFLLS